MFAAVVVVECIGLKCRIYFSNLRLVDVKAFSKSESALELIPFGKQAAAYIDYAKKHLLSEWLPSIQAIFVQVSRWYICIF